MLASGRSVGAKALLLAGMLATSLIAKSASPEGPSRGLPAIARAVSEPRPVPELPSASEPAAALVTPWARELEPVKIENPNARLEGAVRLYGADGAVDLAALAEFRRLVGDGQREAPLAERTVQLALKAAYHFGARTMVVISAYRPGRHNGPHGQGRAIDFKLNGVSAAKLAAYLRTLPRVGVGIYTHPNTQFVHLDVRETSWHWLDASPPGKRWREMPLPDAHRVERDATYTSASDLPETATASTR